MKKLLFLLLFSPLAVLSQTKIVLKGTQVTISSLANIAGLSVVANATGSPATPTAVLLGVGLTFSGGKLAIDTANFKDTIYALNGLQILGVGYNRIGLGGFLSMNTTISASNNWDFTLDSMQAKIGSGFRVRFGNDFGYDMFYLDSATLHWKNFGKGVPGQVVGMLPAGGIGWVNQTGGGGGGVALDASQTIASGTSLTVTNGNNIVLFNPASPITAFSLTTPAIPHNGDYLTIFFGGTITTGTVITTLTVVANGGQTLNTVSATGTGAFGEPWVWKFNNNVWYRIN